MLIYTHKVYPSYLQTERVHLKNSKMKKWIIFAVIATAAITGCNNQPTTDVKFGKQTFVVSNDTMITVLENKTAPRYSCSRQLLSNPVLLEEVRKQKYLSFSNEVVIDLDSLIKVSPAYGEFKKSLDEANSDGWLMDLFKILLAVAAIALLLWFLWWLSHQKPRSSLGGSVPDTASASPTPNEKENAKSANNSSFRSSATSSIGKEDYEGITNLITELHKNSAGGTVHLGSLFIHIPKTTPDITVIANEHSTIGDIEIKNYNVSGEKVENHEGDDLRQYSRGSKQADQKDN